MGELIKYVFYNNGTNSNPDYYLCQWNSSNFWSNAIMGALRLNTVTDDSGTYVPARSSFMYDYLNPTTQNNRYHGAMT
jgi:hypothetical protein